MTVPSTSRRASRIRRDVEGTASPFGLSLLLRKSRAAPALLACKRIHNASACYQILRVGTKVPCWYLFCSANPQKTRRNTEFLRVLSFCFFGAAQFISGFQNGPRKKARIFYILRASLQNAGTLKPAAFLHRQGNAQGTAGQNLWKQKGGRREAFPSAYPFWFLNHFAFEDASESPPIPRKKLRRSVPAAGRQRQ